MLSRPDKHDKKDPELLTQTHLEQKQANRRFRMLADFFERIEYMHLVPQLIRNPDRYLTVDNDPFGSDFLVQIAKKKTNTRNARLKKINNALRSVVPKLLSIEFFIDTKGRSHIRGKYKHWRYSGAWQSEDQFSDGTLRLLGLLWSLQEQQSLILLEEPELSLHPGIIKYIPQMIAKVQARKRRQIFLSTHSAEILTDKGIGLDEVLTLIPSEEGTKIQHASSIKNIKELLDGGLT